MTTKALFPVSNQYSFTKIYDKAIEFAKVSGIISVLQTVYDMKPFDAKLQAMRSMPSGSVGREMSILLDKHGFRLIPKYENHDLKHLILGYGMTPKEEVKMQFFLIGNGNYSFSCLLFASLGIFMPDIWKELREDFSRGKRVDSILSLEMDDCLDKNLLELKLQYQ